MIKYGEKIRVSYEADDKYYSTGITHKFVYRLHQTLAVTGPHRHASGLVLTLWAEKMLRTRVDIVQPLSHPRQKVLTSEMFLYITQSLEEGVETYTANYGESNVPLKPEDIALLNSHLDCSMKDTHNASHEHPTRALTHQLVYLQPSEMLLVFCMTDYRVWCAVHWTATNLLLFNCQPHGRLTGESTYQHGGLMYHITKCPRVIAETLNMIAEDTGSLQSIDHIMVLKQGQ